MQKIIHILLFATTVFLVSCGAKTDENNNALAKKKARLESLKKQQTKVNDEIISLESEIAKLDPSSVPEKTKLVSVAAINLENFTHYIDLQGKIDAENIAYVTPRNGGGQVKAIYVRKGDYVKKGQLLLKLDDVIIKRQLDQAETQLAYAKNIYQRRSNLWKENIGTEVELISAKNNVDQAQKQIDILNEQSGLSSVYADMDGVADDVTIKVGELFTGSPQGGYIRLVNTSNLKVIAQVPENYLDKINQGSSMQVVLPDAGNKTINASVSLKGRTIDPSNRSFYVEAKLPSDKDLHPNQLALVKIRDYSKNNTVTIPLNTLQSDEKGKFVMVAVMENNKMVARKKVVQIGEMYSDRLEIRGGLEPGETLITDGFQGLYDGQLITTNVNEAPALTQ